MLRRWLPASAIAPYALGVRRIRLTQLSACVIAGCPVGAADLISLFTRISFSTAAEE
jgi:hypothetical protein